jgi:hypothetical protein
MNLAHYRDSPNPEWQAEQEPPFNPTLEIQEAMDFEPDPCLKTHVSQHSKISEGVKLTGQLSQLESPSQSPVHAYPMLKKLKPSRGTFRSLNETRTSCALWARRLALVEQALATLRQKLALARNMDKATKQMRNLGVAPSKAKLLERLSDTREIESQYRRQKRRTCFPRWTILQVRG